MPIRPEHRGFYPIDWPELSAEIRFTRAGGRCEACKRPHGQTIVCLNDGTWFDAEAGLWRDNRGKPAAQHAAIELGARLTRVYLATAHIEHDTIRNAGRDLAAWCQRCHILHDAPEHRRRRRLTYLRRHALGDLFLGPYPAP